MLKHALELAGKHDVVPVMVPSVEIARTTALALVDYAHHLLDPQEREVMMERAVRIRFIPTSRATHCLHGLPRTPLLADHTWHESIECVLGAVLRIAETGGPE